MVKHRCLGSKNIEAFSWREEATNAYGFRQPSVFMGNNGRFDNVVTDQAFFFFLNLTPHACFLLRCAHPLLMRAALGKSPIQDPS